MKKAEFVNEIKKCPMCEQMTFRKHPYKIEFYKLDNEQAHVPTQNLPKEWNSSNLLWACTNCVYAESEKEKSKKKILVV